MKKSLNISACIVLFSSLISLLTSILLATYVAEIFFFDKLIYQKSISHGYFQKNTTLESFGERSEDLIDYTILGSNKSQSYPSKKVSGTTILLLGDSYLWGAGVKNSATIKNNLLQRLSKEYSKPYQVISLGLGGDSALDHLIKFEYLINKNIEPDMVFLLSVHNDALLVNKTTNYAVTPEAKKVLETCASLHKAQELLLAPNTTPGTIDTTISEIEEATFRSQTNPYNVCILEQAYENLNQLAGKGIKIVNIIADNKALYSKQYFEKINKAFTTTIIIEDSQPHFYKSVSTKEGHPSAFTQSVYADTMFDYLNEI